MSEVIYEKKDHIAYIKLNRPESLNAINRSITRELAKVWVDFRDDDNLWVAILSGEGKSFCSGADIGGIDMGKWEFRKSLAYGDDRLLLSNYNVWKPVIGILHRHVYGIGMLLALECDIRIASDDVRFGLPEVKVNIPVVFAAVLSDYVARGVASELLLEGNAIDAERAYQLGLINKIVPYDQLVPTAESIAETLCSNGPLATRATKEIFCRTRDMDAASAIALTEHIVTPVFNSEDSVEAKQAFKEKRKPVWKLR